MKNGVTKILVWVAILLAGGLALLAGYIAKSEIEKGNWVLPASPFRSHQLQGNIISYLPANIDNGRTTMTNSVIETCEIAADSGKMEIDRLSGGGES